MRRFLGLAAVAGTLAAGGAPPGTAEAAEDDPALVKAVKILTGVAEEEAEEERRHYQAVYGPLLNDFRTRDVTPADAAAKVAEAAAATRDSVRNDLKRIGLELHDRIGTAAASDPAAAEPALAAGVRSPSDVFHAGQTRIAASLGVNLGASFARLGKALDKAGAPTALVIPGTDTPLHPTASAAAASPSAAAPAAPPPTSLLSLVGTCDGRIVVRAVDPAAGEPSGDSFLAIESATSADVRDLTSAADFASPGPQVFEFTGLAPGNYLVYAGVVADGVHYPREAAVVTVPPCDPDAADPAARKSLHKEAAVLGNLFARDSARDSAEFRSEVGDVVKQVKRGDLTPQEACDTLVDGIETLWERHALLESGALGDWEDVVAGVAANDPAAAALEGGAGMRGGGDSLAAALDRAEDRTEADVEASLRLASKALRKGGLPVSYVVNGAGGVLHPAVPTSGLAFTGNPFTDPIVALLAAGDGRLWVLTRDPAAARGVDESTVEILRGFDFDPVADRRLSSQTDFASDRVQSLEFTGLPPGNYLVAITVVVNGLRIPVALGAITVPAGGTTEPPPLPCTDTTFTATVNGSPFATPPFDELRMQVFGGKFYGLSLRFADPTNTTVPQFYFQLSPHDPIDLDALTDAETVTTKPPADTGTLAYFFFPSQLKFTTEASATYRVRGLRSFVRSGGCVTVEIEGILTDWPNMGPNPFRYVLTMHASDIAP